MLSKSPLTKEINARSNVRNKYFLTSGLNSFIAKHKLQTKPDTSIDAHIIYTIFSERHILDKNGQEILKEWSITKNVIRKKILPENIFEDWFLILTLSSLEYSGI